MALAPGTCLGPYEITSRLGAGGMGEVYRARDIRLDRTVAIKLAAEKFSDRFEREARSIAALNHSNICTLYDVGPNFLVMEYIEGETLDARIQKGALPVREALQTFSLDPKQLRGKWRISTSGGLEPRWRPDGKELFYIERNTLFAVDVKTDGPTFEAGVPKRLFPAALGPINRNRYVISEGGDILVNSVQDEAATAPIEVIVNWSAVRR